MSDSAEVSDMRAPEDFTQEAKSFIEKMEELGLPFDMAFKTQVTSAIRAAMMEAWAAGAEAAGMRKKMAGDYAAKAMGYETSTIEDGPCGC